MEKLCVRIVLLFSLLFFLASTVYAQDSIFKETENVLMQEDGKWVLTGREGTMKFNWENKGSFVVKLPKNGSGLIVSQGFEAIVTEITDREVTYHVRSTGGTGTVTLTFLALQGETEDPTIQIVGYDTSSNLSLLSTNTVTISGKGFGHRAGMSQWGMQGLANRGVSYQNILAHYYPGTAQTARFNDNEIVTVRLNNGVGRVDWLMTPSTNTTISGTNEILEQNVTYRVTATGFTPLTAQRQPDTNKTSITMATHGVQLTPSNNGFIQILFAGVDSRKYLGTINLNVVNELVELRNRVNLHTYLIGVVPREALASWEHAALQAQAVAARTFAASRNFSVRDTQADQVYNGVYESAQYYNKVAQAVSSTRGVIVVFNNNPISAVYSSSNGGWIEANTDAFGSSTLFAYLGARRDLYSINNANIVPEESSVRTSTGSLISHGLYEWERKIQHSVIEQKWPSIGRFSNIRILSRTPAMGVALLEITGSNGTVQLTGRQFRSEIGTMTILSNYIFTNQNLGQVSLNRISGDNRIQTSVMISQAGWNEANTVVIARSDHFADALAGVSLAYKHNAPIILTGTRSLSAETKAEIQRLNARNIIILGGEVAISRAVEQELSRLASVRRIAGNNRYATANQIAREVAPNGVNTVVVVNGDNFPDALSIAPFAATEGYPILLTPPNQLPAETKSLIQSLRASNSFIVGGEQVVSLNVARELPRVTRLAGSSRYDTNVAVLQYFDRHVEQAYIATGLQFADALTGAALAAKNGQGIILTTNSRVPQNTTSYITSRGINQFTVIGGTVAVPDNVTRELSVLYK